MERFLKDCDNESRLVNEEQVIEEIDLETIMESANVRVDEKFRIQERIVDYKLDGENVVTGSKNADEACKDDYWKQVMKEELDQIVKNETWKLVPRLVKNNVIRTKWVFRNKMNEQGDVVRNKERLVCKGYNKKE